MILLHLICLLNTIFPVALSYRYLPQKEIPSTYFGGGSRHRNYVTTTLDVPYHVLVVYSNLYCSGSLVRSRIVVTAASCLTKRRLHKTIVKLGANSIVGAGQVIPVVDVKIHEYYMYISRLDNDIALLVLEDHVKFEENVKKIIPIEPDTVLRAGISVDVSGWGGSNLQAKYMNLLLWTEMIVMNRDECYKAYKNLITASNFCVKYLLEHRLSDNGGPVVYKNFLVGIVSFGATSNEEPYVAVLTNVSHFNRWITLNSNRFLKKYCVPADDKTDSDRENKYEPT